MPVVNSRSNDVLTSFSFSETPTNQNNELDSVNKSAELLKSKTKNVEKNIFYNRYRYFILILCLFCLGAIFSNMTTINFTLICMDPLRNAKLQNKTDSDDSLVQVSQISN